MEQLRGDPQNIGEKIKEYTISVAQSIDAEICESKTSRFTSFKVNGKVFAAIFTYSKKSMTLGVKSEVVEKLGIERGKKMRHVMDARFSFTDFSDENKKTINDLLVMSKKLSIKSTKTVK